MKHHLIKVTYETRTFIIDIACTIIVIVKKVTSMAYSFIVLKVILLHKAKKWHIYKK